LRKKAQRVIPLRGGEGGLQMSEKTRSFGKGKRKGKKKGKGIFIAGKGKNEGQHVAN